MNLINKCMNYAINIQYCENYNNKGMYFYIPFSILIYGNYL